MAEDNFQERTEAATPRRKEQARKKGQVPRSRELASVVVLVIGAIALMWFGDKLAKNMLIVMQEFFSLSREKIFNLSALDITAFSALAKILSPLLIILIVLFIAGMLGAICVGGLSFSWEAARPKLTKLSPLQGIKRMFGKQSVVELVKSILKVALVCCVAFYLMWSNIDSIFQLSAEPFPTNIYHALSMLLQFILLICCSLLLVVFIDVPFQIWQHNEQLKMTKQEIKDEFKEQEGKPEVKGRIRMLQREMAQRRMMSEVVSADVIIANPEHYSVALRYDSTTDKAPMVIAKGTNFMALKIREVAAKHKIEVVSAPPLARALYYSTELEQQIPDGLFVSVAQILAYVFQLKQHQNGRGRKPIPVSSENLPIPAEFRH